MTFFRYPGGKSKLKNEIALRALPMMEDVDEYREPFFGGGSVGLHLLPQAPWVKHVWLNDIDPGIAALWRCVIERPGEFIAAVEAVEPSVTLWHSARDVLLENDSSDLRMGLAKLIVHQMSFSGLGMKSGGPLGGMKQESKYKIDCRWSPRNIAKKVRAHSALFVDRKAIVTSEDFEDLLDPSVFIYLDPPYYVKGNELYQSGFTERDHQRLAAGLKNCDNWLLSYDACPEVEALYSDAKIETVSVNYTIQTSRTKDEYLISSV